MKILNKLKRFVLRSDAKEKDEMWRKLSSTTQPIRFLDANNNDVASMYPAMAKDIDKLLEDLRVDPSLLNGKFR